MGHSGATASRIIYRTLDTLEYMENYNPFDRIIKDQLACLDYNIDSVWV